MTPARAAAPVAVCAATCAATPVPPEAGCEAKWNWSAVPPIPVPLPATVQVPAVESNDWLPASAGVPMSAEVQPAADPDVHMTRDWPELELPTVVTLAAP